MNIYCVTCGLRADNTTRPVCPRDGDPMRARPDEFPPLPTGFERSDYTFTPEQAALFLDMVPDDSYHWRDAQTRRPGAAAKFAQLMAEGRWVAQTVELGFYEHPVRFDHNGDLTHGLLRLIACRDSGVPLTTAVEAPAGFLDLFT